jgi:penicillin-binding protein 2
LVKRTLRHPIRGDRLHPKPSTRASRQSRGSTWKANARQPRMRPRKSVNVASLVGSPEDEPSRPNLRLRVVGIAVFVLFLVLVLRLWSLQIVDGKSFAAAVTRNQVRVVSVAAPRGEIVDRNDTVLVTNMPEQEVLLSRVTAQEDPSIIGKVAALIGQTPAQVEASVKNERFSPYEPVPVDTNASADTVQWLQTHQSEFPGVSVQTITQRTYPQGGTTATHVLGYLGDITAKQLAAQPKAGYNQGSLVGQSGIEEQYETYLRGVDGRQALSVDASGNVVGTLSRQAPKIGDTVVLNLDAGLQEAVQSDLAAQILQDRHTPDIEDHNALPPASNGAAIVMNPQNGQVLAMASYPTYDLNEWVGGISSADFAALTANGADALNNNAIQGAYTPGSTFKLITATADLQDGVYSPARYYDDTHTFKVNNCTGGTCTFTDNPGDSTGEYNLALALTVSSDSYFYNLGELFWEGRSTYGPNAIQNVAAQYGEGVSTGIDLPNEVVGRVDSQTERQKLNKEDPTAFPNTTWYTGDNVEMAFGQGATALTPIEQAVAYATFANGGTRYAPEVASEIVNPMTGKVVQTIAPKVLGHVNLPSTISEPILQGLEGAIANKQGTAYAAFQGFPTSWNLAGKTGTATNPGDNEPNSWFVAFGPNPNPQYVVLAVIDEGGYGAEAAAPLVRSIFDYILANEIGGVKTPTVKTPPSNTPPASNPPFGTPTTTTTTTTTTTPPGGSATTTTAPAATTTTAPPTTTTPTTSPGG